MSVFRTRVGLVIAWVASLVVVGTWASAQVTNEELAERARQALRARTQPPVLISGNDLGFRVERQQGDVPVGTLVVRLNGQDRSDSSL